MAETKTPQTLDLADEGRPIVKFPCGDFAMRLREDISLDEQIEVMRFQRRLEQLRAESAERQREAEEAGRLLTDEGQAEEESAYKDLVGVLRRMVGIALPDLPDEELKKLQPGKMQRILDFFREASTEAPAVEDNGESLPPGASDSTEAQGAA